MPFSSKISSAVRKKRTTTKPPIVPSLQAGTTSNTAVQTHHSSPSRQWHRNRMRQSLAHKSIAGLSDEEIDAHFECMPARYWERVTEDELVWGLQTVHRFLSRLADSPDDGAVAVMDARHFPEQNCTKVLVSTWDRPGLLTRLAGYISALRLNVIRAEVYTRSDNIVLDVFWLCDSERRHIADTERLRQLAFLLEGGLSEPPRFVSTWAVRSHRYLPQTNCIRPIVTFNNVESPDCTIVTIEASERIGLLHDMLEVLNANGLNITEALIDTVDDVARDTFFVTDEHKEKITDDQRSGMIERNLVQALA